MVKYTGKLNNTALEYILVLVNSNVEMRNI